MTLVPNDAVTERTRLAIDRPYPSARIFSGSGSYVDGGTGQSPAVVYPTGMDSRLDEGHRVMSERLWRRTLQPSGFNTNKKGNDASTSTGVDVVATGRSWDGFEDYFQMFMPAAGTALARPYVGMVYGDRDGLTRGNTEYRRHDAEVAIPMFLPYDGVRVVGFFNGRQTHDLVCFLLDRAEPGETAVLFGFTFDHPKIADRMTAAARRKVDVTLNLNAEEVNGDKERTRTPSTLLRMMGDCNSSGCGPSSTGTCCLHVRKSEGNRLRPVYTAWGRTLSAGFADKNGAQHSKVFSTGKFMVVGSTNWTVASEANQELSVLMYIEGNGAAFRAQTLTDMASTARAVTYNEIQRTVEKLGTHFLTQQEKSSIERYRDRILTNYPAQYGTVVSGTSASRWPNSRGGDR